MLWQINFSRHNEDSYFAKLLIINNISKYKLIFFEFTLHYHTYPVQIEVQKSCNGSFCTKQNIIPMIYNTLYLYKSRTPTVLFSAFPYNSHFCADLYKLYVFVRKSCSVYIFDFQCNNILFLCVCTIARFLYRFLGRVFL